MAFSLQANYTNRATAQNIRVLSWLLLLMEYSFFLCSMCTFWHACFTTSSSGCLICFNSSDIGFISKKCLPTDATLSPHPIYQACQFSVLELLLFWAIFAVASLHLRSKAKTIQYFTFKRKKKKEKEVYYESVKAGCGYDVISVAHRYAPFALHICWPTVCHIKWTSKYKLCIIEMCSSNPCKQRISMHITWQHSHAWSMLVTLSFEVCVPAFNKWFTYVQCSRNSKVRTSFWNKKFQATSEFNLLLTFHEPEHYVIGILSHELSAEEALAHTSLDTSRGPCEPMRCF
jgi:hypothetical protein